MAKSSSTKLCCVCLGSEIELIKLSTKDDSKISLQSKLSACIAEIKWPTTNHICEECVKLLNISYSFRQTCLRSESLRQNRYFSKTRLANVSIKPENARNLHVKFENQNDSLEEDAYEDNLENDPNYGDDDVDSATIGKEKPDYKPTKKKKRKKVEFSCEKCDEIYNSSIKLVNHCVKDHDMKKLDVRPFTCDRCPSRFCKSSNLMQHMKYHDAVRSNICTYCGKGFITKTDLSIHEKQHLNKREYKCDECGKCFNTHKDIRSHKLVVHTDSNTWKYCCEICNKPFPIKSNYDSHMRRHTGDKKFECHLCQRKFTDKCVMQRHMRTHSNVREHKCPHCEREYKDPRVLKVHMAKNHGIGLGQIKIPTKEKKYICHVCPKAYYAKNKLTRHLYTHTGEKPYECTICGKKFHDNSYVKQHLRKTHNLEKVPKDGSDISTI